MVNKMMGHDGEPVSLSLELDEATEVVMQQAQRHLSAGQADAAGRLYVAILEIAPDHPAANHKLGLLTVKAHGAGAAIPYLKKALDGNPEQAAYWLDYINALIQDGQKEIAAQVLKIGASHGLDGIETEVCAGVLRPLLDSPPLPQVNAILSAYNNGKLTKAESLARKMSLRFPLHGFAWKVLGATLEETGPADEALLCMQKAARLLPLDAVVHKNLAFALQKRGRFDEALMNWRLIIELEPNHAEAHNGIASWLTIHGHLAEAETSLRRAIACSPEFAFAHHNLGMVLHGQGRGDESEASFRRALAINPDFTMAHQAILFLLSHDARTTPARYLDEARGYGKKTSQKNTLRFSEWRCQPKPARLKVGFVSGDLKHHPVAYFLKNILTSRDRTSAELIAYSTAAHDDDLSLELKQGFDGWHRLSHLDDDQAARLIHEHAVHVLIDLSGHTRGNRLGVFSRKPAPVQASWLGYFATTGLPEMDYVVGDPCVTPDSEAGHFTEKLWKLPDCYLCFTPPDVDLSVGPLPAITNEGITFGCFNNLIKMNDHVVQLWAKVLMAVPGSRLLLKTKQLDEASLCDATLRRFSEHGIGPERLMLEGWSPRADLLSCYGRVDIALDPFPYPGGTTTIEGLWMGVPCITRKGDRFLSHVGETIAINAGLSEWIAADDIDYVAKATEFSSDLDRLARLRCVLRDQVLAGPLFSAERFARNFEAALAGMWNIFETDKKI